MMRMRSSLIRRVDRLGSITKLVVYDSVRDRRGGLRGYDL